MGSTATRQLISYAKLGFARTLPQQVSILLLPGLNTMSEFFELALFSASNSVMDEHYERKSTRGFEVDPQLSKIEVRCKTLDDVGAFGTSNTSLVV